MSKKPKNDEATVGHNSVAVDRLKSIVDRIERLAEERKALQEDISDIYAEAKSAGFDTKVLRGLIAERKKDAAELEEYNMLLDTYRDGLSKAVSDL